MNLNRAKLIPIEKFFDIAIRLPSYQKKPLFSYLCNFYEINPRKQLERRALERLYYQIETEFTQEVGSELGNFLTALLLRQANPKSYITPEELIWRIVKIYEPLLKFYVPILTLFINSVIKQSKHTGINKVYLLARDALPFLPVALARQNKYSPRIHFFPLEVNRRLLGIVDEIAEVSQQDELDSWRNKSREQKEKRIVDRFLHQQFKGRTVGCIDVGYYGTLVRALKGQFNLRPIPYFFMFASANPLIWGFLNRIFDYGNLVSKRIPHDFMWILGDSIEALPKPYHHSSFVKEGKHITLSAYPTCWLSGIVAYLLYYQIYRLARNITTQVIDPWKSIHAIFKLYQRFNDKTQQWTFPILPKPIPEWSQSQDFMQKFYTEFGAVPVQPQPNLLIS